MIPKGHIKLAVTLGECPRVATIMTEFLAVNCLSAFNGALGRPLLQAMKAVISIHCLTMKFPIATRIDRVQGKQWDSRECYNKSLKLAEKTEMLPQTMEVEKTSKWSVERNIDPYLREEESTARPIEELIKVQMDPSEPNRVVKIGKGLKNELMRQLTEFLCQNQDVFAWTHIDIVGIRPKIMYHWLNINPHAIPVRQKQKVLDADRYKALQVAKYSLFIE